MTSYGPIRPDTSIKAHMEGRLIGYDDVAAEALRRAGRDASSVDLQAMMNGISAAAEYQLQQYCQNVTQLDWAQMKAVLDRPDFTPQLFTDYLSTCGPAGAAVHNRFAEVLQQVIPDLVANQIREGILDKIGPAPEPYQVDTGLIAPHPRYIDNMPDLIPTADEVVRAAALQAGRDPAGVDRGRLTSAVNSAIETQLEEYCTQLPSVGWPAVKAILDRPDFNPQLLRNYMSTRGVEGVGMYNALRVFLTEQLPPTVIEIIGETPAASSPPPLQSVPSFSGASAAAGGFDPGPVGGVVTRPAAPPPAARPSSAPSRNLLYFGGAAGLVAILIAVAIGLNAGGGDSAGSSKAPDTVIESYGNSGGDADSGPAPGSGPQKSSNDLNVSVPMSHPPCDGSGIVVLANAVTPGRYASEIQRHLNMHPGSSYLRTDESCSSLRPRDDAGNPIYAVYRPAGRTPSQVCAAVRAAGGDAYGKWLDNTTDPRAMIRC
ncbi:hypothetical protein H7J88_01550 [Mycolicibacterium flavescens]|uniref:Uncharacterized protein n=1 Tax=Mycolicibacterium flavescens TaxID=1776 RepID=A0A1E3RB82_MYCFV|nr:hypothetical protein [Mycolicibacterium flavescens]MCV7278329.1 hypothetical protein [Mycolicibacterium flavescens]ODQ87170.1 hypothetical protein BHQ18_24730 [Mycolicibacterium flavescens]